MQCPHCQSENYKAEFLLFNIRQKEHGWKIEKQSYTLRGSDGYEKTVTWKNMKNGLLTRDSESAFSDLPKAFRVKDVITIEVN